MDFKCKYASFADGGREFVINTPDTPTSWSNKLFSDSFSSSADQRLEGACAYVRNYWQYFFTNGRRLFYVNDHTANDIWSLNDIDIPNTYTCTHRLHDTSVTAEKNGVRVTATVFVVRDADYEVWTLSAENTTDKEREVSLFSSVGLFNDGMGAECYREGNALVKYSCPGYQKYADKARIDAEPKYFFVTTTKAPTSVDTSEVRFFGNYRAYGVPAAVKNGKCSDIMGEMENLLAAFHHKLTLGAGETQTINFMLGYAVNRADVAPMANAFTDEAAQRAYNSTRDSWERDTESLRISTPDEALNHLCNYWFKKQSIWLTRMNRGGTMCPVRNQLQDAMGYAVFAPEAAYKYMMDVLVRQEQSGYLKQWIRTDGGPDAGLGLLRLCDAPTWLVSCIVTLINQMGDITVFDNLLKYSDGGEGSIYEHLVKAIEFMGSESEIGAHGLCLMRDGDWTDPLNGVGHGGKGESTWTTAAVLYAIKLLLPICEQRKDGATAERLQAIFDRLARAINENAFNGEYYAGGFNDEGVPFASQNDQRVFLNAQTWPIMAGITGDKTEKLVNAIRSLDAPFGSYLFFPAFEEYNPVWGRLTLKKSGTTENGAVYCHATLFKAFADAVMGDGDALYDTLLKTMPTNPQNPVEVNGQMPLYLTNYYYSIPDSPNFGRSSCNISTGTVSWFMMSVVEKMLGAEATVRGIRIKPCMPSNWDGASLVRKFNGATYNITVKRGAKTTVNGTPFDGEYLPYKKGESYDVVVGF